MIILVSPKNIEEAREAEAGGADIIDVKNPPEGSLGANFPWVIKETRDITPKDKLVSAAIGDVPFKPGTVSLAAYGAAMSGADYVKVGLWGPRSYQEAVEVMKNVSKSVKLAGEDKIVVAAGYADAYRIGAVDPLVIPKVARDSGCDVAMLDTAVKDGKTLFDHLSIDLLKEFVEESHSYGLKVALAGSIKKEEIPMLKQINCDIVGVRGAACTKGDRNEGTIQKDLVVELVKICRE
ncbi:(5-formylfuran-3-yl)methyl phosphate synthase [Methanococcus voltae]|uniref:(5-formylfuran-3-yl)methyl phosphate synthase n=1 Tax=Methanococcus voltae (strain ATCC BAA-1334 / A3) TaxID=456320 RepID=D7DS38_METV3|nr:(5-formylfuran-3-yl)methyl phosphate synthase [Methanococcus voltae]MCS3901473.1 uncharacterized protein (UPF0264 family) [Methanococcus voltae]